MTTPKPLPITALIPVESIRRAAKITALETLAQTFQMWADKAWRDLAEARREDERATEAEKTAGARQ